MDIGNNTIIIKQKRNCKSFHHDINNIKQNKKGNNKKAKKKIFKNEYDTSSRANEDKESIEKCQDIDEDYFSSLIGGKTFKFEKYIDIRDSVINIFIIIIL